jgi:hypothetical protein
MARVYHAPEKTPDNDYHNTTIFLGGSINNGTATEWQKTIIESIADTDAVIYNPRRPDWDWTWEQSIDNPKFYEQVNWELDHLDKCNVAIFCFDKDGPSPITLLEFGKFSGEGWKTILVCCPTGFWRKGNVDIVARRHHIPVFETLDDLIVALRECIEEHD